jgi:hypothetical protein
LSTSKAHISILKNAHSSSTDVLVRSHQVSNPEMRLIKAKINAAGVAYVISVVWIISLYIKFGYLYSSEGPYKQPRITKNNVVRDMLWGVPISECSYIGGLYIRGSL